MLYYDYESNKKVRYNIFNRNIFNRIGQGTEVKAYLINNRVVKFYKCQHSGYRLNELHNMINIKTKRILLPKSIITDKEHNLKAYTMEYIEDLGLKNIFSIDSNKLKEEMKMIDEDINILDDNKLVMTDLQPCNCVFNDGLYLIDPGMYDFTQFSISYCNKDRFNDLFMDLMELYYGLVFSKNEFNYDCFRKILVQELKNTNLLDYIINNFDYNNLDDLVHKQHQKIRR